MNEPVVSCSSLAKAFTEAGLVPAPAAASQQVLSPLQAAAFINSQRLLRQPTGGF